MFTPVSAALGGALIGTSASALWLLNGRVAGISGILGGLVRPRREDIAWRVAFIAGLWVGGFLLIRCLPGLIVARASALGPAGLVLAGLLVGFGSQLGRGCTSGHGVCGLSRFSKRSFVAVGTFMITGAFAATWLRPLLLGVLK